VIAITIAVCATTADTPLPPPAKVSVMNPNRRFRAVSDANGGTRLEDAEQQKVLWSFLIGMAIFVADDGKHLVTQYDGLNLLPTNFTNDLVLLAFWREGKSFAMSESEISYRTTTFWGRLLRTTIGAR
jgi:hypothetical protein